MTVVYILLIILQLCVVIYFIRQNKKKPVAAAPGTAPGTYETQRNTAISITPQQLKLAIPDTQTLVYGALMDWNMGPATVTLAAYITGAANMYFSTGEGITGGGKSPLVGEAAVEFIMAAQDYIERAVPVATAELPSPGCVRFYFLTNHRMYAAQEQVKHFEDGTSPWLSLFEMGNRVLTEMQAGGDGASSSIIYN